MQSLFEASMYTFVFLWTPALSPRGEKIPHGIVFACFMTACMVGSALTGAFLRRTKPQVSLLLVSTAHNACFHLASFSILHRLVGWLGRRILPCHHPRMIASC